MARRPLVDRLREIAPRLDFVGDEGDAEAVREAIVEIEARERPQLDMADEAHERQVEGGRRCVVCREPIDAVSDAFLHEERGWTTKRTQGGTNALRFAERTGRCAHLRCLSSDPAQDALPL